MRGTALVSEPRGRRGIITPTPRSSLPGALVASDTDQQLTLTLGSTMWRLQDAELTAGMIAGHLAHDILFNHLTY